MLKAAQTKMWSFAKKIVHFTNLSQSFIWWKKQIPENHNLQQIAENKLKLSSSADSDGIFPLFHHKLVYRVQFGVKSITFKACFKIVI